MNAKTLRIFVALSVLLLGSVVVVQYFWFKQAYNLEDRDFDQRVTTALRVVSKRLLEFNKNPNSQLLKPVERVTSNYYTVQVNDTINNLILEEFIKQEFAQADIRLNFEYGIYDCSKDRIRYASFVCFSENCDRSDSTANYHFPALDIHNYYFGVHFPDKKRFLLGDLNNWFVSSAILLVVMAFFVYSLMLIFKQKRLSEIQNDFINNMTHEFKTPISTISISSEVLMKPEIVNTPERLLSYAAIIRKEAARLKKNVDTVLQTANIAQKIDKLNFEEVDVHELLEDLAISCEPLFKEKNGELSIKLNATNALIKADRLHFTNIIHNLIDNGMKYCERIPMIEISTENIGNDLIVSIKDNGIGIADRDQKQVFNKFFRVHTGDVHDVKGFGLGLYYVKEMVEGHKGKIELKSKVGEGSEFKLIVPVVA
ncbi:two-component system phosphate regulon sensor histidine kinase PhoR [Arcicella aurantiaca]|uniref:histidine kinase n=1 Tax=Arcicella aurantiaca TaxID=591202 RepID=A0A316F0F2_9BACT|nr:HAMP domain-containing sensor histidine kinase [Arcicella aurantiaca]PWK29046.1 two-component system phosphate regulon sensor histidine kinase PhoR [Arcicella aurantiaca]